MHLGGYGSSSPPAAPNLVPCVSSIWLSLSFIFYNKRVIVSKALS